ncbi:hypothetical protein ACWDUD_06160, partial [Rhodococcus sp. NPDC003382]
MQPGHSADDPRAGTDTTTTPTRAAVWARASAARRRADCAARLLLHRPRLRASRVVRSSTAITVA